MLELWSQWADLSSWILFTICSSQRTRTIFRLTCAVMHRAPCQTATDWEWKMTLDFWLRPPSPRTICMTAFVIYFFESGNPWHFTYIAQDDKAPTVTSIPNHHQAWSNNISVWQYLINVQYAETSLILSTLIALTFPSSFSFLGDSQYWDSVVDTHVSPSQNLTALALSLCPWRSVCFTRSLLWVNSALLLSNVFVLNSVIYWSGAVVWIFKVFTILHCPFSVFTRRRHT